MIRFCQQCLKTNNACICGWISTIITDIELIILQHPTETKHPLGTAKILTLSLPNSRLFIGEDFSEHTELNRLLLDAEYQHQVLFLDNNSELIKRHCLEKNESINQKQRIILLDGTWKKAYKIWQLSKNLHVLPKVHLDPTLLGRYRVRKAPKKNALSTAEAGYHLLSLLDPKPTDKFSPIITVFDRMIDVYIAQMPDGVYQRNY